MKLVEEAAAPTGEDPAGRVLRLVQAGYRVLAELHGAIDAAAPGTEEAQRHAAQATRELAAIQQIFERRGHGR